MDIYNSLRYGVGKALPNTYTIVRDWFINQFPDYRKNPLKYVNFMDSDNKDNTNKKVA